MGAGRRDHARLAALIGGTAGMVDAWNATVDDSRVLEIAVADVAPPDAVMSQMCRWAQTSASMILRTLRRHQVMLPPTKEPFA